MAHRELCKCWEVVANDRTQQKVQQKGIQWKFICPQAPHWGGFYERLVRSVKTPLKKILGKALINEEEMRTMLTEVEAQINSRPLTHVSDDMDDPLPITPAEIIIGRPLQTIQILEINDQDQVDNST